MFKRLSAICLLTLAACSGSETSELPKAVQNEPAQDFAELTDAIAQDFINYVGDDLQFFAIMMPWDSHKPKTQCFDYWHKKGDFIPTPETINECQLWTTELSWLFGTYGYEVKPAAFKSELFWNHLSEAANSGIWQSAYAEYKSGNRIDPHCPKRAQKNWSERQVIPWGSDRSDRCPPGETW